MNWVKDQCILISGLFPHPFSVNILRGFFDIQPRTDGGNTAVPSVEDGDSVVISRGPEVKLEGKRRKE